MGWPRSRVTGVRAPDLRADLLEYSEWLQRRWGAWTARALAEKGAHMGKSEQTGSAAGERHCVLAVDVGNTSTGFGLFSADAGETDEPLGTWELTTPARLTADEARMQVAQVLGVLARDVAGQRSLAPERA